ncbi:hypothetical protein Ahy_B10g102673 [Arachis hypogaea]|uniref:Aminotransferase-like plant mobile domain-containing protein n=1 Tax=Arachis hypogaea TaxID=3818 RepID=A0A444X255_ARAHY|nr:hypothetical protein Ahy_B10g102673 [Arachis hypogaea]
MVCDGEEKIPRRQRGTFALRCERDRRRRRARRRGERHEFRAADDDEDRSGLDDGDTNSSSEQRGRWRRWSEKRGVILFFLVVLGVTVLVVLVLLGENRLETGYGSFKVRPKTIGAALSINASGDLFPQKVNYKDLSEDDKQIFRRFQGKTLKNLTDEMVDIGVDNEQDRLMFKRIFILYIQMAFLLPTTINKISPVHLAPIFEMDTITERNWGGHALSFIIKGITDYKLKKKKAIDGCLFALMIIYFHLSKNKDKKRAERPPEPWIANWSKEQMESKKRKKNQEDSDSESESTDKTQSKKKKVIVEDSSPEQAQSYHGSEIRTEDLDEFLRENNEKSAAEGEKETDLRSTEGHYVSSETISDVNLGSDDPSSQGHTEQSSVNKPAESMVYFRLSLVEESASEPAEENMVVVREEIPSEALAIVPIQVCLPLSQTTTMPEIEQTPEIENEPIPVLQIEGTTES